MYVYVSVRSLRALCLRRSAKDSLQQPGQARYLLLHGLHTLPEEKQTEKAFYFDARGFENVPNPCLLVICLSFLKCGKRQHSQFLILVVMINFVVSS